MSTVIAGKPSNTVGDKDSVLVLRGSSVKFQWGNKFIDLFKDGKLISESQDIVKKVSSISDMDSNGLYLIDGQIYIYVDGSYYGITDNQKSEQYISFLSAQDLKSNQKETALTNIGFYYDNIVDIEKANIETGIVFNKADGSIYTISNGVINKYKVEIPTTFEELTVTKLNTNNIYTNEIFSIYSNSEKAVYIDNLNTVLNRNLIVDGAIKTKNSDINNGVLIEKDAVIADTIVGRRFITDSPPIYTFCYKFRYWYSQDMLEPNKIYVLQDYMDYWNLQSITVSHDEQDLEKNIIQNIYTLVIRTGKYDPKQFQEQYFLDYPEWAIQYDCGYNEEVGEFDVGINKNIISETRGFITYLKDEYGNEANYNFKNLFFFKDGVKYYTFNYKCIVDAKEVNLDGSRLYKGEVHYKNNKIKLLNTAIFQYDENNILIEYFDGNYLIFNNITEDFEICENNIFEKLDNSLYIDIKFYNNVIKKKFIVDLFGKDSEVYNNVFSEDCTGISFKQEVIFKNNQFNKCTSCQFYGKIEDNVFLKDFEVITIKKEFKNNKSFIKFYNCVFQCKVISNTFGSTSSKEEDIFTNVKFSNAENSNNINNNFFDKGNVVNVDANILNNYFYTNKNITINSSRNIKNNTIFSEVNLEITESLIASNYIRCDGGVTITNSSLENNSLNGLEGSIEQSDLIDNSLGDSENYFVISIDITNCTFHNNKFNYTTEGSDPTVEINFSTGAIKDNVFYSSAVEITGNKDIILNEFNASVKLNANNVIKNNLFNSSIDITVNQQLLYNKFTYIGGTLKTTFNSQFSYCTFDANSITSVPSFDCNNCDFASIIWNSSFYTLYAENATTREKKYVSVELIQGKNYYVFNSVNLLHYTVPSGTIIMYHGISIPIGWVLCDGNNGTPNLIDKFIKGGYQESTPSEPQWKNGEYKITIEEKNLPSHSHVSTTNYVTNVSTSTVNVSEGEKQINQVSEVSKSTITVSSSTSGEPITIPEPDNTYTLVFIMKL